MDENARTRLSTVVRWSFAVATPIAAATSYLLYMANGIAAGDMIGLAGREQDVAAAQRYASYWLAASRIFQAGAVISVFSLLRFGSDAAAVVRYMLRGVVAVVLSFSLTLFVFAVLWELPDLLHHSR